MSAFKTSRIARAGIAVLAFLAIGARTAAAADFELSLWQYELSFGQGSSRHALHLSNFVPSDRFGDLALGENGRVRIPLYSTDPKAWTLFKNSESDTPVQTGGSVGNFVAGLLGLVTLAFIIGYVVSVADETADTLDFEPDIDTTRFDPRLFPTSTSTSSTSTKPAKR